jgi:hypothetical protein
MDWLDRELQEALKRKDPSPDFRERVIGELAGLGTAPPVPRPGFWAARTAGAVPRWLATAAAFVIVAGAGGIGYRQHQGEVAKQQVMQAFRIAGSSLNHIQTRVREANR